MWKKFHHFCVSGDDFHLFSWDLEKEELPAGVDMLLE
jgi:hypothetical protein